MVSLLLLTLSLASWYVMAGKIHSLWQARRCHARALSAFRGAESLPAAIEAIRKTAPASPPAGDRRRQCRRTAPPARGPRHRCRGERQRIRDALCAARSSSRRRRSNRADLLCLVGRRRRSSASSAPSGDLPRPGWLAGATQVVLDKVARPGRRGADRDGGRPLRRHSRRCSPTTPSRAATGLTLARMDGFAHDLHASFPTTGLRGRPGDRLVDIKGARGRR